MTTPNENDIKADFWESAWVNSRTGWDLGCATPALLTVLHSHESALFPPTQQDFSALIPGVGRGYDLLAFAAKQSVKVTGIDISPTAVAEAQKEIEKDTHASASNRVQVVLADFFTFTSPLPFDVAFDHTFLCAIVPSLRRAWASKMAELIKPGGHLICYMFPLRDADEKGPPFALSSDIYKELLFSDFECVLERDLEKEEVPTTGTMDRDTQGKQKISLWKRKGGE